MDRVSLKRNRILPAVIISVVVMLCLVSAYSLFLPFTSEHHYPGFSYSATPAGSSNGTGVVVPLGVKFFVEGTITNSQPVPTPDPYDQIVVFDSAKYRVYEAGNLQNVEWFTAFGQIIPSWIENNATSTSAATSYWLKIPFSIAADSTLVIYVGFVSTQADLFNSTGNEGVYPLASNVYGQYDNGAVVFPAYFNFNGTSIPHGLKTDMGGGSLIFDNGLQISAPVDYNYAGIVTTSAYPSSYAWIVDISSYNVLSGGPGMHTDQLSDTNVFTRAYDLNGFAGGYPGEVEGGYSTAWYYGSGSVNYGVLGNWNVSLPSVGVHGFSWHGSESYGYSASMALIGSIPVRNVTEMSSVYWGSYIETGGYGSGEYELQWAAAVYGLPDDIMPSSSLNTITAPVSNQASPSSGLTFYLILIAAIIMSVVLLVVVSYISLGNRNRGDDSHQPEMEPVAAEVDDNVREARMQELKSLLEKGHISNEFYEWSLRYFKRK